MKSKYSKITLEGIIIFLILMLGIVLFEYKWQIYKNEKVGNEFQTAKSIAASLPKELTDTLKTGQADKDKTEYKIIKNRLSDITGINPNTRFAYLYTLRNNNLRFIVGSDPLESNDYSPNGQVWPAETTFKRPFSEGKAFVTDSWGKWRSALVPLKDETGKTIAVFGMDFTVSIWNMELWSQMADSFILMLLLLLTLFLLLKINTRNKSLLIENTQRKGVEKMLIENKERFRALFYNAPLCYQTLDTLGNIIDVNQQWVDTLGYTYDEAIGKWFGDFLSPAYREDFRKRFPIFKDSGRMQSELELVHKNGKTLFVSFYGRVGYHVSGIFKQAHCILQDITERTQTKSELAATISLLNALLESTTDAIIVIDREDKIVLHNQKFAELWHFPKDSTDDRLNTFEFRFILRQMKNPEEFLSRSKELIVKPGISGSGFVNLSDERIIEWHSQPQLIGEAVVGRVWTFKDITAIKSAEKSLRTDEEKYSSMIAHISEAIAIIDINCIIKYFNPYAENLFGWLPEELYGTNIRESVHPEDADRIQKEFYFLITKNNSVKTMEFRLKCNDGSYKLIELTGVNLANDSIIDGILMNFHIIGDSFAETESLNKANENTEESDRFKSALLTNLSLEIRPPLNSIIGFSELLDDPDLTNEESKEYIKIIQKSGARILNIINDIFNQK